LRAGIIKKSKGQAMTEFVMVIPVFILLLAGICQMSVLMIRRIELAMVEREVMRYVTADGEDKDKDKTEAFIKEYAGKIGLDKDKLTYDPKGRLMNIDEGMDKMGLLEDVGGIKINLYYDEKLMKVFAAIMNRDTVTLKTTLSTAAGSCMKFKIAEKANEVWDKIKNGGIK
jgi:hypothetical protein